VEYTFRYDKGSNDPWDEKDEKRRIAFRSPVGESEEKIMETINIIFDAIKLRYTAYNDYFMVRGDTKKFIELSKNKDYMNMKMVH